MSYTTIFTQTTDSTQALPLYWTDTTKTLVVEEAAQVWDSVSGTYITRPATTVDIVIPGLNRVYGTVAQAQALLPYCKVENNVVLRPDETTSHYEDVIIEGGGGTRFLTSKEVEGFNLTLVLNGLYHIDRAVGYEEAQVSVGIYYRAYDPASPPTAADPWRVVYSNYTIAGKQRAEILKTIKHSPTDTPLPLSKYEILVVRNTEDHTGNMDYADDVYVKDITEILYHSLAYNHTALLGVKIRATDQLSGQLPTVTALVKGVKVAVPSNLVAAYQTRYDGYGNYNKTATDAAYATIWDGTLAETKVWTDNPVWCLYDLLTNARYGLADYYKIDPAKKGLMLANFYLMAKYCDEALAYEDNDGGVPITKYRPRFTMNMVLDQSKSASEWVSQILSIMRGIGFYAEGIFWLDLDRPKPVTQIFNMSNITNYTQSCTSYRGIPNSYEVQWINPLTNYEIDSFKLDSKELQESATVEERKKALQLIGVTSFEQAKALAKYALLAGQHRTKTITFHTGANGLRCFVSDVIGVQHDVPKWGFGGRVESYDSDTNTISISCAVELEIGHSYAIKLVHDTDTIAEYGISVSETGTTRELTLAVVPATPPKAGDLFVLGIATNVITEFRVASIKRDGDEVCEITAVEYARNIFELCDSTSDLGEYTTADYSLLTNPQRVSVQGVLAQTKLYQDGLGIWKTGIEVFYDIPQSSFWKAAQVHYAPAGSGNYTSLDTNTSGYFFLSDLPDGQYQIVVTSVYSSGRQTISDALADGDSHPWAVVSLDNYAPNDEFLSGVTGLTIDNRAGDGTFIGRDCIITWRKPSMLDAVAGVGAGEEGSGAGTVTADNWFSHYEVVISSLQGNTRRTEKVYNEKYMYSHEANHADGITRSFVVTVYAYDRLGRKSEGKSIECSNPAPQAIS